MCRLRAGTAGSEADGAEVCGLLAVAHWQELAAPLFRAVQTVVRGWGGGGMHTPGPCCCPPSVTARTAVARCHAHPPRALPSEPRSAAHSSSPGASACLPAGAPACPQVLSCAGQRVVPEEGVKKEKDPTEPLTQVGSAASFCLWS